MGKPSFKNRSQVSNKFIKIMTNYFWTPISKIYPIVHFPLGYENLFQPNIQNLLKEIYDRTAKFIRFLPDYMVINTQTKESWFLEYKVTRTPRYSERDKQWNIWQIESNAWENYVDLRKIGIRVIVAVFCPYYSRPLLAFFPKDSFIIKSKTKVKKSFRIIAAMPDED